MCGLVGMIVNHATQPNLKWFKEALIADTFRGEHSTGVVGVNLNNKAFIYKRAVAGWDFVETRPFINIMEKAGKTTGTVALLGHNRWATQGSIKVANAHPFRHNHITGMHNGTLKTHKELANGKGKDFEVDSEAIIYALSKAKGDYADVLHELNGSFALTWHDQSQDKIYLARNKDRPLSIAVNEYGNVVLWASEMGMLRWLVSRAFRAQKFNYHILPENEIWSLEVNTKANVWSTKEVVPFVPKPQQVYTSGYTRRQQRAGQQQRTNGTTSQKPTESSDNLSVKKQLAQGGGVMLGLNGGTHPQKQREFPSLTKIAPMSSVKTNRSVETLGLIENDLELVVLDDFRYYASRGISGKAYGYLQGDKDVRIEVPCADYEFDAMKTYEVKLGTHIYNRNGNEFIECTRLEEWTEDIKPEIGESLRQTGMVHTANDTISLAAAERAVKGGCSWCADPIALSMISKCHYLAGNDGVTYNLFCESCTKDKAWEADTYAS